MMGPLEPLILQAVMQGLAPSPPRFTTARKTGWVLMGLAGIFGLATVVAFAFGTYAYLLLNHGLEMAGLMTAGVLAGFTTACLLGGWAAQRWHHHSRKSIGAGMLSGLPDDIADLLKSVEAGLEKPVGDYPKTSVALAGMAGYALGSKLH